VNAALRPREPAWPQQGAAALCFSGGGYRAMTFRAGALIQLSDSDSCRNFRAGAKRFATPPCGVGAVTDSGVEDDVGRPKAENGRRAKD